LNELIDVYEESLWWNIGGTLGGGWAFGIEARGAGIHQWIDNGLNDIV
jgi:hypothetical protein